MAVSSLHEGLLELVRKQPELVPGLLSQFLGIAVPAAARARISEPTLNETKAVEYHADAAVLMTINDKPVLGAIVEAQLSKDDRKRFTWPHYATGARARHECTFVVIVLAPDAGVARWAREPIDLGFGSVFRPLVIGPEMIPEVTTVEDAARDLPLAALSVTAHGRGDPRTAAKIALAVGAAAARLDDTEQAWLYFSLIHDALSEAAKEILRMTPEAPKYFSEPLRRSFEKGVAQGQAAGQARALLAILEQRGLPLTDNQRRQVQECTDLTLLDRWLSRALSVTSVDELLA